MLTATTKLCNVASSFQTGSHVKKTLDGLRDLAGCQQCGHDISEYKVSMSTRTCDKCQGGRQCPSSQPQTRLNNAMSPRDVVVLYPQLHSSLEIRKTDQSGRGLWAQHHFKPGSVVLAIEPHVCVLSNQYLDSHCSSCASDSTSTLRRCSGCGTTRYCNVSCQKADWSMHKPECAALQKWAKTAPSDAFGIPSDAVRCLGRILWRMKSKGLDSGWSKEIQAMQHHKVSPQQLASVEAHVHLAHSVVRYLDLPSDLEEYGIMSTGDLVNLISRFVTNTLALTSPSLTPIGVTVSPLVALTNHSCLPNAAAVFPRTGKTKEKEPVLNVIALRDIKPGEELLMAYIDTTLPKAERQKALSETYNFICHCPLCDQQTAAIDPREAVLCPRSCGGGSCPLPNQDNPVSHCSKCNASISDSDAVIDIVRIGQEALDKATRLQSSDADKARQLTSRMIPILSARLAPSAHPLLALLKLDQTLSVAAFAGGISQAALDACVITAGRHVAGLAEILEEGHPVRGIALAELGKLLAVDEPAPSQTSSSFPPSGPARLKMAYESLVKARAELLIGFGRQNEGGEVGLVVRESIVALEKELGVWMTGVRNVLEDGLVKKS